MSRDILPRRLGADTFLSRHSAQPFERALVNRVVLLRRRSFVLRFVTRNGEILLPPGGSISLL